MELDSPDVEDFPGLYAAEIDEKAKKSKDGSDGSEGEHDKLSKKDLLIGRRKDKKDKKDRGYAALEGESSPEEELDSKSPSKSRKSKAFKFTSSKSKEKREKSRDKEKLEREARGDEAAAAKLGKEKEKDKKKDKDKKKEKEKEREKDKKFKEKDKKDKKLKHVVGATSEEILELGDVQPVFGVSINLATDRSRCHDGIDLPLVVRDCIDYLQEHALKNEQIYKVDPVKTRLQQFKRLYNNRERQSSDELDMPTACGLLKTFLSELPEPILTTDLMKCFEEVASHPQVTQQEQELRQLFELLPERNRILLAWILLHFDSVLQNERYNKLNAQTLAMLLSPCMQMSHRLLVALLCHAPNLFASVQLIKYIPPLTASSPKLPETPDAIKCELRKQESLLAQIHAEMNAGFVAKRREEQLWEVQRIITQLKRKLRSFEKKMEKSMEELPPQPNINLPESHAAAYGSHMPPKHTTGSDEEATAAGKTTVTVAEVCNTAPECVADVADAANETNTSIHLDEKNGLMLLPKGHPEYYNFIQLQIEHQELLAWKTELQARITAERAEILQLKQLLHQQQSAVVSNASVPNSENACDLDTAKLIENYIRENALFEHLNTMLAKEIFEERKELVAMQVELAMQQLKV